MKKTHYTEEQIAFALKRLVADLSLDRRHPEKVLRPVQKLEAVEYLRISVG